MPATSSALALASPLPFAVNAPAMPRPFESCSSTSRGQPHGVASNVNIKLNESGGATRSSPCAISRPMRPMTTTRELADACTRLAAHPFVAVDTEFLREQTYWPVLCLIQMAGPDEEAIVDPLARGIDLKPFYELMANERV